MPDESPRPAKLPGEAPPELRQFVACTTDRVRLDLGRLGWLPKPKGLPGGVDPTPTVSIADGATSSSATINLGWAGGFISIDLPASIVDGELRVDASDIGFGIGDEVDEWTAAFNRTLNANGKQLDSLDVDGDHLTLTKKEIVVVEEDGAAGAAGVAPVTTAIPSNGSTPDEADSKKPKTGCLAWVAGAAVAVLAAVGITLAVTGGDDDDEAVQTADSTEAAPPVTDEPVATEAPITTDAAPATEAPPATDETASVDPVVPAFVCGDPDTIDSESWEAFLEKMMIDDVDICRPPPILGYTGCPIGTDCLDFDPIFVVGGTHGIDHTRQVVDARTGQQSASTATREYSAGPATATTDLWGDWFVVSDCGGTEKTGTVSLSPNATAAADLPLLFYGNCEVGSIERTDGPFAGYRTFVAGEDSYVVDDPQPAAGPADGDAFSAFSDGLGTTEQSLTHDANLIHQVHAGGRAEPGCQWFFAPDDVDLLVRVLDRCSIDGNYWVFASGLTDVDVELSVTDTVAGTTATYVNPVDSAFSPVSDSDAFTALYDNTVFPCGWGHLSYTACADGEPDMAATNLVTIAAVFPADVPIEGDGAERAHLVQVDDQDGADGAGTTYAIRQGADGWTVESSSGSTRARALFRNNSITLVLPADELPSGDLGYTWATEVDGARSTQPFVRVAGLVSPVVESSAADDPAPPPTDAADDGATDPDAPPPAEDADAPTESIEDFYAQLSASVAAGDVGFAFDRLDPRVLEAYPDSCPAALESFADPDLVIEFLSLGPVEDWTYEANGQSFEVPGSQAVNIRLNGRGQAGEPSVAHVSVIDGQYRWFTFC